MECDGQYMIHHNHHYHHYMCQVLYIHRYTILVDLYIIYIYQPNIMVFLRVCNLFLAVTSQDEFWRSSGDCHEACPVTLIARISPPKRMNERMKCPKCARNTYHSVHQINMYIYIYMIDTWKVEGESSENFENIIPPCPKTHLSLALFKLGCPVTHSVVWDIEVVPCQMLGGSSLM